MKYEPKILYNPTNEKIEFMHSHRIYQFAPGEKKNMDGFVAHLALKVVNTGLKEYDPQSDVAETSDMAYDKMSWKDLVSLGSKSGIFKPGMKKAELIRKLVEADGQEA